MRASEKRRTGIKTRVDGEEGGNDREKWKVDRFRWGDSEKKTETKEEE